MKSVTLRCSPSDSGIFDRITATHLDALVRRIHILGQERSGA